MIVKTLHRHLPHKILPTTLWTGQMYSHEIKVMFKKRNLFFSFFYALFDADFSLFYVCSDKKYYKIHGTIALTATAPLLNLNLNYEKLRHKDK